MIIIFQTSSRIIIQFYESSMKNYLYIILNERVLELIRCLQQRKKMIENSHDGDFDE